MNTIRYFRYVMLTICTAISANTSQAGGPEEATLLIFEKVNQQKASKVLDYAIETYANATYFSSKDRIVTLHQSFIKSLVSDDNLVGTVIRANYFEDFHADFKITGLRKHHPGMWTLDLYQIVSSDVEAELNNQNGTQRYDSLPPLRNILSDKKVRVHFFDIETKTGSVSPSSAGINTGLSNSKKPNQINPKSISRRSIVGLNFSFYDFANQQSIEVDFLPEIPKYHLVRKLDSNSSKQIPTDYVESPSAETQAKIADYNDYVRGMRGNTEINRPAVEEIE